MRILITELQTLLNAGTNDTNVFTLTYDEQTQKVNIAVTGGSGVVTISASDTSSVLNTLRIPLGFDAGQTITQASNTDGNNVAYTINELNVKLTDANGNVVDLHNVPWGFEVIFYEWNRNPWKNR